MKTLKKLDHLILVLLRKSEEKTLALEQLSQFINLQTNLSKLEITFIDEGLQILELINPKKLDFLYIDC